jgi:hypothetical protein
MIFITYGGEEGYIDIESVFILYGNQGHFLFIREKEETRKNWIGKAAAASRRRRRARKKVFQLRALIF